MNGSVSTKMVLMPFADSQYAKMGGVPENFKVNFGFSLTVH